MRKIFCLLILFTFVVTSSAQDKQKYGNGITLTDKTSLEELLTNPEKFDNQKVLVEGTVEDVCSHRGCWLTLRTENGSETIKVKVKDGEIVFPFDAKGKTALVEGEIYSFAKATDVECAGHEHEEGGGCCSSEQKETMIYQIRGLGAVI